MTKRPKFKPEVTRVKLNPEQAVLSCSCVDVDRRSVGGGKHAATVCTAGGRTKSDTTWEASVAFS